MCGDDYQATTPTQRIIVKIFAHIKNWFVPKDSNTIDPEIAAALGGAGGGSDKVLAVLTSDYLTDRRKERQWRSIRRAMWYGFFLLSSAIYFLMMASFHGYKPLGMSDVVGVIKIDGAISSGAPASAEKLIPLIQSAFENKHVIGLALNIDSPGGQPVEAERIYSAIDSMKKKYPAKKVIAVINNLGASAAYMIALHADEIYCGRYSLVGSIGAIVQTWDVHGLLNRFDVHRRVYASGELKSMLDPYMEPTPASKEKAQQLVNQMGSIFVADLTRIRGARLKKDVNYGTGEVWTGTNAKEYGLVDDIGTLDQIVQDKWNVKAHNFGPNQSSFPLFADASDLVKRFTAALTGMGVTIGE